MKKFEDIFLFSYLTDRQTDRQTDTATRHRRAVHSIARQQLVIVVNGAVVNESCTAGTAGVVCAVNAMHHVCQLIP